MSRGHEDHDTLQFSALDTLENVDQLFTVPKKAVLLVAVLDELAKLRSLTRLGRWLREGESLCLR